MLHCLICRDKMIQTFYDCRNHFYLCHKCYLKVSPSQSGSNYRRISLLRESIDLKSRLLHRKIAKFVEKSQFTLEDFYRVDIFDEYFSCVVEKKNPEELSAAKELKFQSNIFEGIELDEDHQDLKIETIIHHQHFKPEKQKSQFSLKLLIQLNTHTFSQKIKTMKFQLHSLIKQTPSLQIPSWKLSQNIFYDKCANYNRLKRI